MKANPTAPARLLVPALALGFACLAASNLAQDEAAISGWRQGRGWGWIWGDEDEHGALNAMTDATRREALALVREGRVYDLGVRYSRNSMIWPGHSPGEVMTFRTPEGIERMRDLAFTLPDVNPERVAWHSCGPALYVTP